MRFRTGPSDTACPGSDKQQSGKVLALTHQDEGQNKGEDHLHV